ncbi:hypothetical protein M011DRAFT_461606 [Sporormia fimetaria CBS 119925]|uniref:2EXR domain-containing protein n=1 Tax=Sporormia fimetaria CBS 119925 TaxID=1340428 RepID=A0A6A6V1T8_9PLEO|nr:hypothetical protein M011DRAFT_461606 [Sporormia fimetaria CBS 119925]
MTHAQSRDPPHTFRKDTFAKPLNYEKHDETHPSWRMDREQLCGAFHCFRCLPFELRLQIWEFTFEPRTVKLRYKHYHPWSQLVCANPIPAILHACREARSVGLKVYGKALANCGSELLEMKKGPGKKEKRAFHAHVAKLDFYINWDLDTISIGKMRLEFLLPVKTRMQRLKLDRDWDDSFWEDSNDVGYERDEHNKLGHFGNLREIHVVTKDKELSLLEGIRGDVYFWPCDQHNITFESKETGELYNIDQLEARLRQEWDEEEAKRGYVGPSTYPVMGYNWE